MTSEEQKERWRKTGLCMKCGRTQTHRHFLGMKQPLVSFLSVHDIMLCSDVHFDALLVSWCSALVGLLYVITHAAYLG